MSHLQKEIPTSINKGVWEGIVLHTGITGCSLFSQGAFPIIPHPFANEISAALSSCGYTGISQITSNKQLTDEMDLHKYENMNLKLSLPWKICARIGSFIHCESDYAVYPLCPLSVKMHAVSLSCHALFGLLSSLHLKSRGVVMAVITML